MIFLIVALQIYFAVSLLIIIRVVRNNGIDLYKAAKQSNNGWLAKLTGFIPDLVIYREYYKIKGANMLYTSNILSMVTMVLIAAYLIAVR